MKKQKTSKTCYGFSRIDKFDPLYCFGAHEENGYILPSTSSTPNLVGCRQMCLGFSEFWEMYRYGKWINLRGDFLYDLSYMKKLVKQARDEYFECPYMDVTSALRFIAFWPRIVNPNEDERLAIWPPTIGKFEEGLLEIGLSLQGPPPTPNGEEYPVFTDTSFFLELISEVYGNEIEVEKQKGLLASFNLLSEQILHYFD